MPNTSEIMYVYGFFDDFSKTLSNVYLLYKAYKKSSAKYHAGYIFENQDQ